LTIVIRIHVTSGVLNHIDWGGSEYTLAQCSLEGAKTRDAHISEVAKRSPIPSILDSPVVEVVEGRPDLEAILSEEARMAKEEMSVCGASYASGSPPTNSADSSAACGPDSMVRATRAALQFPVSGPTIVLNGGANVVLHVESFGYA
jgi:ferric-chelate reductase